MTTVFEWFNCFYNNLRILYHLLPNGNLTRQLSALHLFLTSPVYRSNTVFTNGLPGQILRIFTYYGSYNSHQKVGSLI